MGASCSAPGSQLPVPVARDSKIRAYAAHGSFLLLLLSLLRSRSRVRERSDGTDPAAARGDVSASPAGPQVVRGMSGSPARVSSGGVAAERVESLPSEPDAIEQSVGPFLSLRHEKSKSGRRARYDVVDVLVDTRDGYDEVYVLVENIASFPVALMPKVVGGRFMKEAEDMPNLILEPGEVHKLTRLSTDQEHYRMDCYESGMPHFVCNGISKRVDPTDILLRCQPAARDSEGWYSMAAKDGVPISELWKVDIKTSTWPYIHQDIDQVVDYLKYELMHTCVFLDGCRPLKRVNIPLEDIRYCQDSCGQTFRDGKSLESTVKQLRRGEITVATLGVRVVEFGSTYFALDNRRLRCAKLAFPPAQSVPVLLADLSVPSIKKEWDLKFTAGKRILMHEDARRVDAHNAERPCHPEAKSQQLPQRKLMPEVATATPGVSDSTAGQSWTCSRCSQSFPRRFFSAAQLKKKEARRCRHCVGAKCQM